MSGPTASGTDVDALFKLPLDEFTTARNALVAQLKKAGRQAEAGEAKALAKPSVSAWVVNQLYWRHRKPFDRLIEAGDRLRRAQQAPLTGDSAREPANARREAVIELATIAGDVLRSGHYSATRDMLRRVMSTLEALSSYGSLPDAPPAGRLTDDVEPPGFEALAALMAGVEKRGAGKTPARGQPPRTAPVTKLPRRADARDAAARRAETERKDLLAAAKAAVREAEGALRAARKRAERAAAKLEMAATRAKTIERQRARIEARLAEVAKEAGDARTLAAEAAAAAHDAATAVEGEERALELARQGLQQVGRTKIEKASG